MRILRISEITKIRQDVHAKDDYSLRAPASVYSHFEVVELLLKHGANVHANDDYALGAASKNGHWKAVRLLLKHGAKIWKLRLNEKNFY